MNGASASVMRPSQLVLPRLHAPDDGLAATEWFYGPSLSPFIPMTNAIGQRGHAILPRGWTPQNNRMQLTGSARRAVSRPLQLIRVFDRPEGPTMMAWEPQLACRASRAVHGGKATARATLLESPGQHPMERAALVTDRSLEVRRSIPSESDQFVQKGPGVAPGNRRPPSDPHRHRPRRGLVPLRRAQRSPSLTVVPTRPVLRSLVDPTHVGLPMPASAAGGAAPAW
jgi:hypothetical protein